LFSDRANTSSEPCLAGDGKLSTQPRQLLFRFSIEKAQRTSEKFALVSLISIWLLIKLQLPARWKRFDFVVEN
jgi:hypothetical protein